MAEEELAIAQASAQNIRTMVEKTALAGKGDPFHSELYMNVHDAGVVTLIGGQPGSVTQSYCTFKDDFLSEVSSEQDDGTQAIIDVADFLTYGLDFASDGGELRVALRGEPGAELAKATEFYGAVNARMMNTVAGNPLEEVPTDIVNYFPEGDGEYVSQDKDKPFPTHIHTDSEVIRRVIDVVDHDPETKCFPITVEDEELQLDVGRDSKRNAVWGELQADDIEGPDVNNDYKKGFEEVFKSLSGEVWLQTAPNASLCVVQDNQEGMVLRHIIGSMSQR